MSSVDLIFNLLAKDQTSAAFRSAGNSMGRFGKDAQAAGKAAAAAGKSTAAAGKDVESAGARMHKALAGLAAGAGLAVLGKQAADFAKSSVEAFTTVGKESGALQRVMGGTIEEASQMRGMFALAGVDADQAGKSMARFSRSIVDNGDAFAGLGIAVRDANGQLRPTNDILKDTAERFKTMPNGAEKTALALELFGKSGTAMLPMLNRGAEGIAELEAKTAEYGLTLTKVDQEAIAGAIKAQRELDMAMQGAKVTLGAGLAPLFTEAKTQMAEMAVPLTQALLPGFQSIGDVALLALTQIRDNMPAVQAGVVDFADGVRGISEAIQNNWPEIVSTVDTLAGALERVGAFAGAMWDAFRSLPPEVQQVIALLAVAQKTGVIDVAFKGAELVKGLVSNIQAAVVNVNGAVGGVPGGVTPSPAGRTALLTGIAGAGLAAGALGMNEVLNRSTESLSRSTSAANVYASALEGARQKTGETAAGTRDMSGATAAAGGAMTVAGLRVAAMAGAVSVAGQAAGLTQDQIVAMSAAVQSVPPGANADQLGEAIRVAGEKAGLSDTQIQSLTAAAWAVPGAAELPALQSAIAAAGQAAGLTQDQVDALSMAVVNVPPGASAQQMGEALRVAGEKAGLTDAQIRGVTDAVYSVPSSKDVAISTNAPAAAGEVNALQAAINSLQGKTVDVGVSLSGSTGGGTGGSTYSGGASGIDSWLTGSVTDFARELAPALIATGVGSYSGPGSGILGLPMSGYTVSSEFGPRWGTMHEGIDLAAPMGQGVFAAANGLVTMSGWNGGYGNYIAIDHGNGLSTTYGHMSALIAGAGQIVGQGALIGQVGSTGDSTGPHLHFETRVGGSAVDPRQLVAFDSGGWLQPGITAAINLTGKPEPVFTDDQWRTLRSSSGDGGRTVVEVHIDGRVLHESLVRYRRETGSVTV